MRDKIECARLVFQDFLDGYEQHLGTNGYWTLGTDGEDDPKTGLTSREWNIGVAILTQKGLTEKHHENAWVLTDDGNEVCAHPDLLDDYLGPRGVASAPIQHVQHNVIHGGTNQIGDHNTQNITYRAVLQAALEATKVRDDVPAAVADALRELRDFPDIEALMSEAAGRIARK